MIARKFQRTRQANRNDNRSLYAMLPKTSQRQRLAAIAIVIVNAGVVTQALAQSPGPDATAPTAVPPDTQVAPADKPADVVTPAASVEAQPVVQIPESITQPATTDNPYQPRFVAKPAIKRAISDLPELLAAPTGYLLGAGDIYSRSGLDTGGGVSTDLRVGLGDVAEFGIATTDQIRARESQEKTAQRISPYVTASFRMGVAENRLFRHQPGLTLGFRKSFQRDTDSFKTQIAELTLVASKHLGSRASLHAGAAFWDASISPSDPSSDPAATFALHDQGLRKQLRGFGGVAVKATNNADVLIDVAWAPEFCYQCTQQIKLRALLSWGVRYNIADWIRIESGVRVSDIQSANLLDAQIFGQLTFVSHTLRNFIEAVRD
jgi:hypothetical protein